MQGFAATLAASDPAWGTESFPVADGLAVLCGPGLYVNRVLGLGFDADVDAAQLDDFESRALTLGLDPSIECCEATRPEVVRQIVDRGYVADGSTVALIHDLDDLDAPEAALRIDYCEADELALWQATAALGWGHDTPGRRRASDAFAAVASLVDEPGLMLARSASDDRVVGCATLKITGEAATLGGMSTVPAERRQGVQTALIRRRLQDALDAGCRYAMTSAEEGSASERNLRRLGFRPSHTKVDYVRPPTRP